MKGYSGIIERLYLFSVNVIFEWYIYCTILDKRETVAVILVVIIMLYASSSMLCMKCNRAVGLYSTGHDG